MGGWEVLSLPLVVSGGLPELADERAGESRSGCAGPLQDSTEALEGGECGSGPWAVGEVDWGPCEAGGTVLLPVLTSQPASERRRQLERGEGGGGQGRHDGGVGAEGRIDGHPDEHGGVESDGWQEHWPSVFARPSPLQGRVDGSGVEGASGVRRGEVRTRESVL